MKDFLQIIKTVTQKEVANLISLLCGAVKSVFDFLSKRQDYKKEQEIKKEEKKNEKDLKDVCVNGSLQDLINTTTTNRRE